MADEPLPAGPPSLEADAFLAAAAEGRLLLKRSVATGRPHWYPRALCPFDGSDTEWFEASGDAVLYSFSTVAGPTPYVVAYVTLAEGPTMLTNLVDCDPSSLAIGQALRVVFRRAGEGAMPCFTPSGAEADRTGAPAAP